MFHVDTTVEDLRLIADRDTDGTWMVRLFDNLTGKSMSRRWSDKELGSVLLLALIGDEAVPNVVHLANAVCGDLPREFRPIP